ncbi:transcriptional regulatory protein [Colletotrichum higginsianum]|nr:transcriptional regulatory protein [Colletotrichum higginsianum]
MLCVATAHSVLQELCEKLGSARQNSPWHVLLFTFAAASTLVVATLCPDLGVDFDTEPTRTSWDRALHIFEFHKRHVSSAARGIEVLQKFRESVAAVSRQEAPSGPAGMMTRDSSSEQATIRRKKKNRAMKMRLTANEEANHVAHTEQGDLLMPFGSVPGLSQTPVAQDFGDFLSSDLLNESWFNTQGIDFGNWALFP